jgi:methionyl-tRNA formyltransferase
MMHAWVSEFTYFNKNIGGNAGYVNRVLNWEKESVKFENYLRALAGEKNMRLEYDGEKLFTWESKSVERFKNYYLPIANYMTFKDDSSQREAARDADNTTVKPFVSRLNFIDSRKQKQ